MLIKRILDWRPKFDDRSKLYGITDILPELKVQSKTWECQTWLDQGREGACVGFGLAHALCSEPLQASLNNQYAKETIYWEAQRTDEHQGGSYPGAIPHYEGTSVLAGVKVVQKLGWIDAYHWAFSLDDLIIGVGNHGPAVLGVRWYESMYNVGPNGYLHVGGKLVGGHCIECRGVDVENRCFILRNSWGKKWGWNGDCKITFEDLEYLLKQNGEAVFFDGLHMQPTVNKKPWFKFWR